MESGFHCRENGVHDDQPQSSTAQALSLRVPSIVTSPSSDDAKTATDYVFPPKKATDYVFPPKKNQHGSFSGSHIHEEEHDDQDEDDEFLEDGHTTSRSIDISDNPSAFKPREKRRGSLFQSSHLSRGSSAGVKVSRSTVNSSERSQYGIYGKVLSLWKRSTMYVWQRWLSHQITILLGNVVFKILSSLVCMIMLLSLLMIVLWWLIGRQIPDIMMYNLTHAIMAAIARLYNMSATLVLDCIQLSVDGELLVRKGLGLTSVVNTGSFRMRGGNLKKFVFLLALAAEAVLVLVGLGLTWTPTMDPIEVGPCIPATYPNPIKYAHPFGNYLQGDTDFAMIYNYGLPLANGVVGGWAAWPLDNPSSTFTVMSPGIGYVVGAACEQPTPNMTWISPATDVSVTVETSIATETNYIFAVTLPSDSHSVKEYSNISISQRCSMRLLTFGVTVEFSFVSDEWAMVTGGQIVSVRLGNLAMRQRDSSKYTVDDVVVSAGLLGQAATGSFNLNDAITTGLNFVSNDSPYLPTQGASFCNLLQWATLPDGLYHPEITWKGVSAVASAVAHQVLMQYDQNANGTCTYTGLSGKGVMSTIYPQASIVVTGLISLVSCIVSFQVLVWYITRNDKHQALIQRAADVMTSPLRALYALKDDIANLLENRPLCDDEGRILELELSSVIVKLGEDRNTRDKEIGRIKLGGPKQVVKMTPKRDFTWNSSFQKN